MRVSFTSHFTNRVKKLLHGFPWERHFSNIYSWNTEGPYSPLLDIRPFPQVLAPLTLSKQVPTAATLIRIYIKKEFFWLIFYQSRWLNKHTRTLKTSRCTTDKQKCNKIICSRNGSPLTHKLIIPEWTKDSSWGSVSLALTLLVICSCSSFFRIISTSAKILDLYYVASYKNMKMK